MLDSQLPDSFPKCPFYQSAKNAFYSTENGAVSTGIEVQGHKTHCSFPYTTENKNVWSYTSTPEIYLFCAQESYFYIYQ
jgi:hypothetical protein